MKLEDIHYDNAETGCCALIDPADWDGKEYEWEDKLFIKDRIRAVFHMPINFGQVATRTHNIVKDAEAFTDPPLWLSDENSLWGSDLYVAVDREVPGADMARMSGSFVSKVYEGPYGHVMKWMNDMRAYVTQTGRETDHIYAYYTACPRCAKQFKKNYVVLFAQVH